MKHLFIINPAAGSRDQTEKYTSAIHAACDGKDISYEIQVSQAPGQCREIARAAAQTGQELRIYACGGDGTLNEVVSGVAGYDNAAVTMYAGGSGNDFIRIFNDTAPFRDLERLLDAQEAVFDLIRCNDDYSLNICSVGLDARIGTDVANYKRIPLLSGFRAYAVSALINTIRGVASRFTVEIDGVEEEKDFTLICACNGRFYGGGFNPVPDADPADGILEVLTVEKVSRLQVLNLIGKYKAGRYKELPKLIHHYRTDHLTIRSKTPMAINLDGELRTAPVLDIRLAKEKIRFFYPKGLVWSAAPAEVK